MSYGVEPVVEFRATHRTHDWDNVATSACPMPTRLSGDGLGFPKRDTSTVSWRSLV